jgi:hypothetical protein
MVKANVAGIASYSGSAIEELARERYGIEDKDWAGLDATAKAMKMKQFIDSNPNIIKEVQQSAASEIMKRVTDEAEQQAKQYESEVSQIQGTHIPQAATQSAALTAQRDAYLKEKAELEPQQAAAQATQEEIEAKTGFNISLATPTDAARYNNAINTILRYRGLGAQIAAMDSSLQQISTLQQDAQNKTVELANKAAQARSAAQAFVFKVGTPQSIISSSLKIAKQLGIADMESGANQVVGATMGFDKNADGNLELNRASAIPAHKSLETGNYTYGSDINTAAGKAEQEAAKLNIERKIQEIPVAPPTPAAVVTPPPVAPATPPSALDRFDTGVFKDRSREPKEIPETDWTLEDYRRAGLNPPPGMEKQAVEEQSKKNNETMNSAEQGMTEDNKNKMKDQYTPAEIREGLSPKELQAAENLAQEKANADRSIYDKIMGKQAVPTEQQKNDALYDVAAERMTTSQLGTSYSDRDTTQPGMTAEEQNLYEQALKGGSDGAAEADKGNKEAAEKQQKEAKESAASDKEDRDAERKEMQADRSGKGAK